MTLCSGAFDGVHAGHVRYLRAARHLDPWDTLIVAVAPDAYIQRAKHRTPRWSQADRVETVWALGLVDWAVAQCEDTVAETIRTLKPTRFVKGADWRDALPTDVLHACQETQTAIVFVDTPGRHVRETR